jgi:tetratricopeptide (TPR) repeat protein
MPKTGAPAPTEQELDPKTHATIEALCAAGDRLAEKGRYDDAIDKYEEAWELVPAPQEEWEAGTWILAAIADAYFLADDHAAARQTLEQAMASLGAEGNPFLHMRYGQVLFDACELDAAAEQLAAAYEVAGVDVFEAQDEKYLKFLGTRIEIAEE